MSIQRLIFVFLDGLGLAAASANNPLASAHTPALHALLGGPLTTEQVQQRAMLLLRPIDATMGVPGLPQSGTGHTALLAGVNAAQLVGRHQPHTPPTALRPLLAAQNIFGRVQAQGQSVAFANLFTPRYWQALTTRSIRRAASVIAAEGAGVRLRTLEDYVAGAAVPWDITGAALTEAGAPGLPELTPQQAGERLAALATTHALVFFECFLPDLVGHGRLSISDEVVIERIDGLLSGILATLPAEASLIVTSDHGNIEDRTTSVHTRNPVPLLVAGPAVPHFVGVESIVQIADAITQTTDDRRPTTDGGPG